MEKIKVNMSPNPLDVQTIHVSQNDGEARQWEFELHNNGELIDTSDVKEQLVFKAYKGGTEQLLPENTSTPTTSPFKGDIKYPQGLLTNQEFTYRQSPTEEDGLAKITDIKGNTLVWNQLQQSASASQTINGITYTVNSDGSITANGTATATSIFYLPVIGQLYANHKYLVKGCPSGGTAQTYMLTFRCNGFSTILANEVGNGAIVNGQNYNDGQMGIRIASGVTLSNAKFYPQVFDLTQMGLDITDPSDITSLFSLPYYAYNQGSLLSFMGNGIKTVGKNLLMPTATFPQTLNGVTYTLNSDGSVTANGTAGSGGSILIYWDKTTYGGKLLADGTYKLSGIIGGSSSTYTIRTNGFGGISISSGEAPFTITDSLPQTNIIIVISSNITVNNVVFKPMIRRADVADNTFEPYTSSTLSLPISTYFPTGMKSAGSVYDELTESKAITRIGAVDMGTLNWNYVSADRRFIAIISDAKSSSSLTVLENIVSAKYENATWENILTKAKDKIISLHYTSNNSYVAVIDNDYSDASTFKSAMSGVMLYYELSTPTETSLTTASLVTENAEIPLSNEDGTLIGKCTEELSAEPGFHDAKIKLADANGECYSNKIQLHVERKPS